MNLVSKFRIVYPVESGSSVSTFFFLFKARIRTEALQPFSFCLKSVELHNRDIVLFFDRFWPAEVGRIYSK